MTDTWEMYKLVTRQYETILYVTNNITIFNIPDELDANNFFQGLWDDKTP